MSNSLRHGQFLPISFRNMLFGMFLFSVSWVRHWPFTITELRVELQILFFETCWFWNLDGTCTSTPLVSQTSPHECIFLQRSVKISSVFLNKTAMTMLRSIPSTVFLRFHSFLHFQAIPYSWKNLAPVKVKWHLNSLKSFLSFVKSYPDVWIENELEQLKDWKAESENYVMKMLLASRDRDVRSNKCRTKPRNQEFLRYKLLTNYQYHKDNLSHLR